MLVGDGGERVGFGIGGDAGEQEGEDVCKAWS